MPVKSALALRLNYDQVNVKSISGLDRSPNIVGLERIANDDRIGVNAHVIRLPHAQLVGIEIPVVLTHDTVGRESLEQLIRSKVRQVLDCSRIGEQDPRPRRRRLFRKSCKVGMHRT